MTGGEVLDREVALKNDVRSCFLNNRIEDGARWLHEKRGVKNDSNRRYPRCLFLGQHIVTKEKFTKTVVPPKVTVLQWSIILLRKHMNRSSLYQQSECEGEKLSGRKIHRKHCHLHSA